MKVANTVKVKVMRVGPDKDIPLPAYESEGSSGMDLRACVEKPILLNPGEIQMVRTGLAISVPSGYEGQIRPRSGIALRNGIGMVNSPGTIDSDYRGEIGIILINWGDKPFLISRGDRIAQLIVCRVNRVDLLEVEALDNTQRGKGGFGHTGIS